MFFCHPGPHETLVAVEIKQRVINRMYAGLMTVILLFAPVIGQNDKAHLPRKAMTRLCLAASLRGSF